MIQKKLIKTFLKKVDEACFEVKFWDDDSFIVKNGEAEKPEFTIEFNEKLDLNELKKSPQLKLGEA